VPDVFGRWERLSGTSGKDLALVGAPDGDGKSAAEGEGKADGKAGDDSTVLHVYSVYSRCVETGYVRGSLLQGAHVSSPCPQDRVSYHCLYREVSGELAAAFRSGVARCAAPSVAPSVVKASGPHFLWWCTASHNVVVM
jgi:hypothetical protein